MTIEHLADAADRERALDTAQSFIVQAPAGSGKTGLLIQRFLALLARVEKPEEVVAITFTRKAAAEMRVRIVEALAGAGEAAPEEDYLRLTWTLANAVIARDEELNWGLALNPSRLQLMTIDALAASLVRQMPVLSGYGANPTILPKADHLYRRAARRLLASLESDEDVAPMLRTVLVHLDNNAVRTEALLVRMLATRDHWLPHVVGAGRGDLDRGALEAVLVNCVEQALTRAGAAISHDMVDELVDIAAYAAGNVTSGSPLSACLRMDALPDASAENMPAWVGLRHLLLTGDGKPRKRVTAREGFPAPSGTRDDAEKARRDEFKKRLGILCAQLADMPLLVSALADLDVLPPLRYRTEDWQMLDALTQLLPLAAAELAVVFQEAGVVDFTEVTRRALTALGADQEPTNLALQLDYRIQHLLVDEFQDTSLSHFQLLSRLVDGWQPNDGRTLFLVGDPMQSIYRFREAQVGLFLSARENGIADVHLEPLALQANFRSRPTVVEFCNRVFSRIFPARESIEDSAVSFVSSQAARASHDLAGSGVHAYTSRETEFEAQLVAQLVARTRKELPGASIAILVRSRTHLVSIIPALREHGHRYRAVDIEKLATQSVVSDLFALTRALLHLGDRTAWLAILRAPWCGLELNDLMALTGGDEELTAWELIISEARRVSLSRDGMLRLARVKSVLAKSLAEKGRRDLRLWVEGTWTALGGPGCVRSETEMANALAYLDLLEKFEDAGGLDDLAQLETAVEDLYAQADASADDSLQVMTIHKAKGLEFDVVIIPGLHRSGASDKRPLLMWLERTNSRGTPQLLLAPIQETGEEDPIGKYITRVDRHRDELEQLRLLYVATTRARERVHLLSRVTLDKQGQTCSPTPRSLAARLWPALGDEFDANLIAAPDAADTAPASDDQKLLRRVPSVWMLPQAPRSRPWRATQLVIPDATERPANWAGDTARHIGTTVHRVLQQVALEGIDRWIGRWSKGLDHYLARMLAMLGVNADEQDGAVKRAQMAIRNTLKDQRGRWILARHESARAEMPLSAWIDGRLYNVVLDRTFVDEEGARWIIDYKTSVHEKGTVETFLDDEYERYRGQLELYARVMQRYDASTLRLGLYFPLVQGWRDWRPR